MPRARSTAIRAARLISFAALSASGALAQVAPSRGHWELHAASSGVRANPSAQDRVVWSHVVALDPATPWLRVFFAEAELGEKSFLRIVSLRDGDCQRLHAHHLAQWRNSTAYFNGNAVAIELVAAAGSMSNRLAIEKIWAGDAPSAAPMPQETICGPTDDRSPSSDARVGRLLNAGLGGGCTGWLIDSPSSGNDRCHLTAGHCASSNHAVLQFNVPASNADCSMNHPASANQYAVDTATWQFVDGGVANDYCVFRCFVNPNTGRTTFQAQGAAFAMETRPTQTGITVRVTGYGVDGTSATGAAGANASCVSCAAPNGARNQVQQSDTGIYGSPSMPNLAPHQVDTCGGNSGAPIVREDNGIAVGIHTHGGCTNPTGSSVNHGTHLMHPGLQAALRLSCGGGGGIPNDECYGAILLAAGTSAPFSTAGATTSSPAWSCGATAGSLFSDPTVQEAPGETLLYRLRVRSRIEESPMRRSALCAVLIPFAAGVLARAQEVQPHPELAAALARVSADELRSTISALVECGTRNTYSESAEGPRGVGAARRWLRTKLESFAAASGGRLRVEEQWFDLATPRRSRGAAPANLGTRGANVIATLPGKSDAARIYVVGGHYDSRASEGYDIETEAPGANDDGSGTAVVVELARVLSALELEATIVLACYTGEEQGLLGSIHHAQVLADAKAQVAGMITNDIVGNTLGDDLVREAHVLRVFSRSTPGSDAPSRQWARFAAETMRAHVPELSPRLVFRLDRFGRGGDHKPFDERGVAALRFTEPHEAFTRQHQDLREEGAVKYGDVLAGVDFAYLANVTRANLALLYRAAQAPAPPNDVRVRGGGGSVELRWSAVGADDLEGYEIVRRATTAAEWEESVWSGAATEARLKLSPDDHIYGVRAVDRHGWKSPVAAPRE